MKERILRYLKAIVAAATTGLGTAVAVATTGPGASDLETYVSAILVGFLTGTAVALTSNRLGRNPDPQNPA